MTIATIVEAAGMRFPAFEEGEGIPVLLLHGFPDGPETWNAQLPALSSAGYRALAVTGRGYSPECQPVDGDYHLETLAKDVVAWIDALGMDSVHLVGHDWGATVAYAVAMLAPERLLSLTTVAVPHPGRMFAVAAADPEQIGLYDYTQLFQTPDAIAAIQQDDHAYLQMLWRRWSPNWQIPPVDIEVMKHRMSQSGVGAAGLQYYVQAGDIVSPIGQRSLALMTSPVSVPTLGIAGREDRCNLVRTMRAAMIDADFPAGVSLFEVAGAGHFPHRERPAEFNDALIGWLDEHSPPA
jgi:pimeloyl-ACP methyl ester carboxylesterase